MQKVSWGCAVILAAAFVCSAAGRPAVPAGPFIASVEKKGPSRFWKQLASDRTQTSLATDIYRIEGVPGGQPPEIVASVGAIWDRVQQAVPFPGQAAFYVDDCSAHSAEALGAGAVRICRGMLRVLTEEDHVAAVLAHETAHLILGHTDAARSRGTGFAVLEGLTDAAVAASIVWSGGAAAPFFATLIGGSDAAAVPSGWMDRVNQREELDADKLGIDLMVRAGFTPQAFLDVLALEGSDCGSAPTVNSPQLALLIDTSKRFTHPDAGRRACAAREYIQAFYSDTLSRRSSALPWSDRGPKAKGVGVTFFQQMDRAEGIANEVHDARVRRSGNPVGKSEMLRCSVLVTEARALAARYPADRDLRRLASATALGCGDYNRAFDALSSEMAPGVRTRPATFQTVSIAVMDPNPRPAVGLYSTWLREDFVEALKNQKPSAAHLFMLQNDALDTKDEYQAAACVIDSPPLKAAYDQFCNEAFSGSPAASTCSHQYEFKGVCTTTRSLPFGKPMGPLNFLATQSRWYAIVLDK